MKKRIFSLAVIALICTAIFAGGLHAVKPTDFNLTPESADVVLEFGYGMHVHTLRQQPDAMPLRW